MSNLPTKRVIISAKDATGAYIPVKELVKESPAPPSIEIKDTVGNIDNDLDEILLAQITALARMTKIVATEIANKTTTKDTPNQLSTLVKITIELKSKQKELLDALEDDELEAVAKKWS